MVSPQIVFTYPLRRANLQVLLLKYAERPVCCNAVATRHNALGMRSTVCTTCIITSFFSFLSFHLLFFPSFSFLFYSINFPFFFSFSFFPSFFCIFCFFSMSLKNAMVWRLSVQFSKCFFFVISQPILILIVS